MYSPYAVAGYLPVAPELIQTHLLQLLAAGEANTLKCARASGHVFMLFA